MDETKPQLNFTLVHLPNDQIRIDAEPPHEGCPAFPGVVYVIQASSINPLLKFPNALGLNAVEEIVRKLREQRGH